MAEIFTGNFSREVIAGGHDITEWVTDLPGQPRIKPGWGEIPSISPISIGCRADDYAITNHHPAGIFYGKPVKEFDLEIKQAGVCYWKGTVADIQADMPNRRSNIIGETDLQRTLHKSARLDTTATTPANAAKLLLELYGIPIEQASFARAIDLQNDIPLTVRVWPDVLEWSGTLSDLLQQLATAGVMRFYQLNNGSIGCDHFAVDSSPVISTTISDDDILQQPGVTDESFNKMDGYSIQWLYGTETSAGSENDLQTLDFGPNSAVQMTTSASATYCGETWLDLSNRNYLRVDLAVNKSLSFILDLTSWITIQSNTLGINQSAELIGIDDSDPRWTRLTCRIDKGIS